MTAEKIIIEISPPGDVTVCLDNGEPLTQSHATAIHWADACSSGDCQSACEYIRDFLEIEFRTVALQSDGSYKNIIADATTKQQCCEEIYFESDRDFSNESWAETYLIWQAASHLVDGEWTEAAS